jgi:ABC-type nitrate/sulfonate/bicarbonate transport system substrate-binding protein
MVVPVLRRWLACLAFLVGLCPVFGAATYRIATTPWMGWAFLDVADAKGFWREQGLAVELVNYSNVSYLDAQMARMVDFSCAMIGDAVWLHTHCGPVRILMETDWSLGGDKFFVRKGLTLAQLQGRPVGYYQNRYSLPIFLQQTLGGEFRHVLASPAAVFSPPDLVAQFNAGRLDLGVICDPYAQDLGPEASVVCTSATRPGSVPEGLICFRDVFERMPAKDLQALIRGIRKAQIWMRDTGHAQELMAIVQSRSFRDTPFRNLADMAAQMGNAPVHSTALMRRRNASGGGLEQFLGACRKFLVGFDPAGAHFRSRDLFDPAWTTRALAATP